MTIRKYERWNASRKTEVALVLLNGEPLEEVTHELSTRFLSG